MRASSGPPPHSSSATRTRRHGPAHHRTTASPLAARRSRRHAPHRAPPAAPTAPGVRTAALHAHASSTLLAQLRCRVPSRPWTWPSGARASSRVCASGRARAVDAPSFPTDYGRGIGRVSVDSAKRRGLDSSRGLSPRLDAAVSSPMALSAVEGSNRHRGSLPDMARRQPLGANTTEGSPDTHTRTHAHTTRRPARTHARADAPRHDAPILFLSTPRTRAPTRDDIPPVVLVGDDLPPGRSRRRRRVPPTGFPYRFDARRYGNATTDDLWSAWEKASGQPITEMMSQWTTQLGFPLLELKSATASGPDLVLALEQSWCVVSRGRACAVARLVRRLMTRKLRR